MATIDDVKWFWNAVVRSTHKGKFYPKSWKQFDIISKMYIKSNNFNSIMIIVITCIYLILWSLFI